MYFESKTSMFTVCCWLLTEIILLSVTNCIMVEDSVPRIKESENATLIQKALSELGESEQRRVETIQTIRQWILTKPSLAHVKIGERFT